MDIHGQVWVGQVGDIILARLQGQSTAALLKECNARIVALVKDAGCTKVLYHLLDLEPSPRGLIGVQQALNSEIKDIPLKRAILVPDAQTAFRAAIAFGWSSRVFSDMAKAVLWLEQD